MTRATPSGAASLDRVHRRARPPLRSVFGFSPRPRIRAKSSAGRWPVHSARPPLALQSTNAWTIRAENSYWNGTRMNNASTSDDQRIISLWLPHLPTDRIVRRRFGRSWRSNPASAPDRLNNRRWRSAMTTAMPGALAQRGMRVADARAMHPALEFIEAEPRTYRRLLVSLASTPGLGRGAIYGAGMR